MQTRDFVYVTDTVGGLLRFAACEKARGQVFNLGSGQETTVKAIVEGICDALGYGGDIEWQPERTADVRRHLAGVEKTRAMIGKVVLTPLEGGLLTTVAWSRGRNGQWSR